MKATSVESDLDDRILDFLRGEQLTSREIYNGLTRTLPDLKFGSVIKSLSKLEEKCDVKRNSTTCKWSCVF